MIATNPYYLYLHNLLNKMTSIVCNFLFSRNHGKNELIRVCGISKGEWWSD